MIKKSNNWKALLLLVILAVGVSSCSVYKTMVNFSRLKFKLKKIKNFKLANFSINGKSSVKDFNPLAVINLTADITRGELPVSFNLIVTAKNPNSGKGFSSTEITIEEFPWTLYINGEKTVSGTLNKAITVPGMREQKDISLNVRFNLMKLLKNKGVGDIIDYALSLGGKKSLSNLKLVAEPVLGTPIGNIGYPESITIISKDFR